MQIPRGFSLMHLVLVTGWVARGVRFHFFSVVKYPSLCFKRWVQENIRRFAISCRPAWWDFSWHLIHTRSAATLLLYMYMLWFVAEIKGVNYKHWYVTHDCIFLSCSNIHVRNISHHKSHEDVWFLSLPWDATWRWLSNKEDTVSFHCIYERISSCDDEIALLVF